MNIEQPGVNYSSVNQAEFKEIAWLLMLIPFGIVSGTGVFFIFCAWRRASKKGESEKSQAATGFVSPFQSIIFEPINRWLVVKCNNPSLVQAALNLHQPTACSWDEGLSEARDDKLFISPPVNGWILVIGSGLPGPFEDVDKCFVFLTNLSRKLGQVQFFSASRVVNHHAWAMVERGRVYRAYAWAGEPLWAQGPMTSAERELDLRCFAYGTEQNAFTLKEELAANTEKLGQLAARWSIDPAAVATSARVGHGIVGGLSHSKLH